jgi:tetrahydromethanopterin S-methyltransferase subunit G
MEMLAFTADFQVIARRFGNIADEIEHRWGSQRLVPYLRELIAKARNVPNGRPSEFPDDVVAAMEALCAKHERECPPVALAAPALEAASAPAFDLRSSAEFDLINARFQRLGAKVEATWGTKALSPFINELLHDTRDGTRQGFPPDAAKAFFTLMMRHDELFPDLAISASDIWTPKKP